jgi:hypothetical protein
MFHPFPRNKKSTWMIEHPVLFWQKISRLQLLFLCMFRKLYKHGEQVSFHRSLGMLPYPELVI